MAKKVKSRLDELWDAEVDYSMPINVFAKKARALFNKMAKDAGIKTKVWSGEYNDGAARLYLDIRNDPLSALSGVLSIFALNVHILAADNKKLSKLELPIIDVTMDYGEITINF